MYVQKLDDFARTNQFFRKAHLRTYSVSLRLEQSATRATSNPVRLVKWTSPVSLWSEEVNRSGLIRGQGSVALPSASSVCSGSETVFRCSPSSASGGLKRLYNPSYGKEKGPRAAPLFTTRADFGAYGQWLLATLPATR
jgi:hypothetical protein